MLLFGSEGHGLKEKTSKYIDYPVKIKINDKKIVAEKYLLNATTHPKDKGPFPEYTLWYAKNEELLKFRFINWKDKKEVITIRNNWDQ